MIRSFWSRKGQISFFIILAIVIVAAVVIFFALRTNIFVTGIDPEFVPIYNLYGECVKQETENALNLLGTQGGKIDVGEYVPGSEYAPFSSHLNFLGFPIPYWYYVSGNNLIKENVPSRNDMEQEISEFLEERINECDFSNFYEQGFFIELDESPRVKTKIEDNKVSVDVSASVVVFREDKSARKNLHRVVVESKIGKFHKIAREIYDKEKNEAFLEEYAVDVLRLYAPVDGVEVQCSPKIWKTQEVVNNLQEGLEANIRALKLKGKYYNLNEKEDEYFVIDHNVDESVNFLYLRNWPSKIEITPANEELMIAEPIGNQQGLGILGFCYVPYHFVYDVSFPVLIQIHDGLEIFQFPISVIIDNNLPREAELLSFAEEEDIDICSFKEGNVQVYTFDSNLNPVEAEISYKCFDSICRLGETESSGGDAVLNTNIPLCVNGYIIAKAEGFVEKKQLFSSNSEIIADVILDREYEVEVELRVAGKEKKNTTAIVHFSGEDGTASVVLPENNKVKLKEGLYDIDVFVYGDSSVVIPSSRKRQCFEVSKGGLFSFFGATKEECIDIEIPEVRIDYALTGGGKTNTYILESELKKGRVVIDVSELPKPNSLEQLQYNYEIFNSLGVEMVFI
ncbi:MAG: hypothetical protein IIA87_00675 [Nanoarchaeota archaeon]|nr:hypothetical protein [Nanoarchaeota archaeon]